MSNAVPVVGSDDGTWGTILNQFLAVSLDVTTGNLITANTNENVTNFPSLYPSGSYWTTGNNPNYAQTTSPGLVQLAGDLAGTATSPALAAITTANSYTNANITIDAKGRVTTASSGFGKGFVIAMATALG